MTERYQHYIPAAIAGRLMQEAAAAEANGSLTAKQLELIYQEKWFKLFVPKSLGGLELSLVEGVELEEAFAYLDGSLGWTITLCAGASFFAGYLNPATAQKIFETEQVCFAGSGQPAGIAVITNFGYNINGHWQYASGAAHATIFTANCYIEHNGQLLKNADDEPIIQAFYFTKSEVEIIETWQTTGLIATSGYSFAVQDLFVPKSRTFSIHREAATISHPIYRFPFLQFAEATIAANTLGMAFRFVDLCRQIFEDRDAASLKKDAMNKSTSRPTLQKVSKNVNDARLEDQTGNSAQSNEHPNSNEYTEPTDFPDLEDATAPPAVSSVGNKRWLLLATALDSLDKSRVQFYDVLHEAWNELLIENAVSAKTMQRITVIATALVWDARNHVTQLYPHCGLLAADPRSDINRVWRDIHTASQHSLLK